jgi:hypothetical protein
MVHTAALTQTLVVLVAVVLTAVGLAVLAVAVVTLVDQVLGGHLLVVEQVHTMLVLTVVIRKLPVAVTVKFQLRDCRKEDNINAN